MNRTNQSTVIKAAINSCLEKGLKDKQDIYSTVVTELGVPRPTVRRVAKDLREELLAKIQILQSETKSVSETKLEKSNPSYPLSKFLIIISITVIF